MQTPLSPPRAAYIHVPFCAHRCGYCDFTVIAGRDDLAGDYLRALALELSSLGEPREIDTLFVGGGTPTRLALPELEQLLLLLRRWLPLSAHGEFSIEANPAGFAPATAELLTEHGVNRVSLGVQSFSTPLLHTLERDHDADVIAAATSALRGQIDNYGFDLIYAVPGQTLADWQATLESAVALEPAHISTYGLTYEKGTSFWTRRALHRLDPIADALEADMYAAAVDGLPEHGFRQYELSNFARPGRESRHNAVYWEGLPYFGFGPGASSYISGTRRTNHRSVTTWLKRVLAGQSGAGDSETLSPENRAREAIWLGLRRVCGIERATFAARFGMELDALTADVLPRLVSAGWIDDDNRSIRLTRAGRFMADAVARAFL